jgi:REP element-mobilizing transposase RayT
MPKAFYRRKLPHLQRDAKPHFVTFCTHLRWLLPEPARQIALASCLHDNQQKFNLRVAVVMPDHVHIIFTPLINQQAREVYSLAEIMDAIKGASAHQINRLLGHSGKVWQTESFDRVLRSSEKLHEKVSYILENPVRKGLVSTWTEYPWIWYSDPPNPFSPTPSITQRRIT